MSSPKKENKSIEPITIETVRAYLRFKGLAKPRAIRPLRGGVVNPAFMVDEALIIRFNVRDRDQKKFLRERLAYEALSAMKLPIPRVLDYQFHTEVFEGELLVTERLPGRRISDDWARLDDSIRESLTRDAARILQEIHSVKLAKFGSLENPDQQFSSWGEYLSFELQRHLQEARSLSLIDAVKAQKIEHAFRAHHRLFDEVRSPCLVHGDFHFGNVLAKDERVTAVIDFEWALAGDPLMDFRNQTNLRDSSKGAEVLVRRFYNPASWTTEEQTRVDFYVLLIKLEMISVSAKHWLGKVSWAERNDKQIWLSLEAALARLTSGEARSI